MSEPVFPVQDYIMLAGEKSPGRATPVKAGSPRSWDKRKGYGYSGATLIYMGDDLSEFDVIIDLWHVSQRSEWERFSKRTLEKPPIGQRPKALDISHPVLNATPLNISAVVVKDVSQFDVDEHGLWTCSIMFSVFRAPLPMLGRPKASIPAAAKPVPTAQDAAEVEIQKLLKQFNQELVR